MFAWLRKVLNNPWGIGIIGSVLGSILFELLKLLVRALGTLDYEFVQRGVAAITSFLQHPIPLGYLLVLGSVFLSLFWYVRRKLDLWPFGSAPKMPNTSAAIRPAVSIVLRCIGWEPPTNHDKDYIIDEQTRLRFTLDQLLPAQKYTFYFRFWSEGRDARWIGITNSPGTNFFSPQGNEVSLTETTNARPDVDIKVMDLIRKRFPNFEGSNAVINRFRLRGDAMNLSEVIATVTLS